MLRVWPPTKVLISFLLQNQVSLSDTLSTSNNLQPKKNEFNAFLKRREIFSMSYFVPDRVYFPYVSFVQSFLSSVEKKSKKKEEDEDVTMVFRSFLLIFLQT